MLKMIKVRFSIIMPFVAITGQGCNCFDASLMDWCGSEVEGARRQFYKKVDECAKSLGNEEVKTEDIIQGLGSIVRDCQAFATTCEDTLVVYGLLDALNVVKRALLLINSQVRDNQVDEEKKSLKGVIGCYDGLGIDQLIHLAVEQPGSQSEKS